MTSDGSRQRRASDLSSGPSRLPRAGERGDQSARQGEQPGVRAFEEGLEHMEEIARALEEGQLPLDEAIARYEQGMRLYQACQAILERADLRVRRLAATESGEFTVETLEIDMES